MARYDHRQVQRVRFARESSFAADMTTDIATNYRDLRVKPTVIARGTLTAPDETVVQRFFQRRNYVLGPDRGGCQIEAYFTSTDQPLGPSETPTKTAQSEFLEALLGGYHADEGSTIESSPAPTTTGCTVASGDGALFEEGTFVGIPVGGVVYPRLITSVSTDAIEWWPALPAAPTAGSTVYNAQSIYFDEASDASLQVLTEAAVDRGNIWQLRGAQGDLAFTLDRGGLCTWTSALQGALYEHDDELANPLGGSPIGTSTLGGSGPIWGSQGGVHFGPSNSTTLSLVRCQSITINPGISWIEVGDHSGPEGVGEWERDRGEATAELVILKNASDGTYEAYQDAFKSETDFGFMWWVGAAAGKIPAIAATTCQIMAAPEATEVNGLEAIQVQLLIKENGLSSSMGTAIQRSPLVIGQV